MNAKKVSKLIKEIRKKHNLTQKELADKYNVTYQAVSKWENGKNLPDMMLLKQISKDFNISLDDILEGKYNTNKRLNISIVIIMILISGLIYLIINIDNEDFKFKTITTECNNFKISGIISYSNKKSAIYIDTIEYCGGDNLEIYQNIECNLYETNNNIIKRISTCDYKNNQNVSLEKFLENINITIDNYYQICKEFKNNLYLEINATDKNNKITTYKVPLTLKENCSTNS
ncbi:MAG: helix-turn-helix transcriptional regulator [Mollicutes bacterium]|nr:helix-turn-helix transcriptional regulator [Mollicutes bacterium]